VFELCDGGNVNQMLHRDKQQIADAMRLRMARDIAAGLAFLHSVRLLHRDLR
jgi:serine/threonine protein kinase